MDETSKLKICVIGAGASGLCAVRHLLAYNKREDSKRQIEPVVFEKSHSVGGLWNYEEAENNAHSSIYKGLRSNLPKENTALINIVALYLLRRLGPSSIVRQIVVQFSVPEVGNSNIALF